MILSLTGSLFRFVSLKKMKRGNKYGYGTRIDGSNIITYGNG